MNFLHRLRQRLTGQIEQSTVGPALPEVSEQDADTSETQVAFDQVERLSGSGASLETLLEMNRVQGW